MLNAALKRRSSTVLLAVTELDASYVPQG